MTDAVPRWCRLLGGCLVAVGLGYLILKVLPESLASKKGLNGSDQSAERGRIRTALVALVAGAVAVIGAYFTARTFQLSQRGQNTDRFSRSVEQLGHEYVDVRLGGIFGLEQLARDSPPHEVRILEVLTAHVREHFRSPVRTDAKPPSLGGIWKRNRVRDGALESPETPQAAAEVQAVIDVLARRDPKGEPVSKIRIDLSASNLSGVRAERLDLKQARLWRANLRGTVLPRAVLNGANLVEADLTGAVLHEADLRGAVLTAACLGGADLQDARHDADTRWEEATYDDNTTWPSHSFNPAEVGAARTVKTDGERSSLGGKDVT